MIAEFDDLVGRFTGLRVLVVGDVVLDTYVEATASGLAREAPVPALNLGPRHQHPGAAANTACNLAAMGATTALVGVVGGDGAGVLVTDSLGAGGVDTGALLAEPDRATPILRRVQVDGRILLRLDDGDTGPVPASTTAALAAALSRAWPQVDAVVVSDYERGVLTPALRLELARLQHRDPRLLMVDARRVASYQELAPTVVKPNWTEAAALLPPPDPDADPDHGGDQPRPADRLAQVLANAAALHTRTGARIVAVTLDADGALLLEHGYPPHRTFARPAEVRSTVGSGDAFTAALTLALASGASVPVAAELASRAADVVTARDRTSTCSARDLVSATRGPAAKVADRSALAARLAQDRSAGQRIVFTNGCFDLLHLGHITLLNQAKALGDVLVVGVNSDAGVARLKGQTRPINSAADRMGVLSALSCVDHLVCFDEDTADACLRSLVPHVYVKGGDYRPETVPEAVVAASLGIDLRIVPLVEARSTTAVIERIRSGPGPQFDRPGERQDDRPGEPQGELQGELLWERRQGRP